MSGQSRDLFAYLVGTQARPCKGSSSSIDSKYPRAGFSFSQRMFKNYMQKKRQHDVIERYQKTFADDVSDQWKEAKGGSPLPSNVSY